MLIRVKNINLKKALLTIIVYFCVMWSVFQYSISDLFGYWDELIAMFSIVFLVVLCRRWTSNKYSLMYFIFVCAYIFIGLLSNCLSGLVSIKPIAFDLIINLKYPLCLLSMYSIYYSVDVSKYTSQIKFHIDLLSIILISTFIFSLLFDVFPVYEVRFGIESIQMFYAHPTFCAAATFLLLMLRIVFIKDGRFSLLLNVLLLIIIIMTLRFKAIASVFALLGVIFLVKNEKYKQLKIPIYLMFGLITLWICYDQIRFYFSGYGLHNFPRGVLLLSCFTLMKQYFPVGAGFASFGSYYSGVYYSPIYEKLGIELIDGISSKNINAITDQYWPMVIGQTGILGFLAMLMVWVIELIWIEKLRVVNKKYYLAAVGCYLYVFIASTSESAVCNPTCIPMGLLIGLLVSQVNNKHSEVVI